VLVAENPALRAIIILKFAFKLLRLRSRQLEASRDLVLEDPRRIIFLANSLQLLHVRRAIAGDGLLRLVCIVEVDVFVELAVRSRVGVGFVEHVKDGVRHGCVVGGVSPGCG
jgi:hypothetical protein